MSFLHIAQNLRSVMQLSGWKVWV